MELNLHARGGKSSVRKEVGKKRKENTQQKERKKNKEEKEKGMAR